MLLVANSFAVLRQAMLLRQLPSSYVFVCAATDLSVYALLSSNLSAGRSPLGRMPTASTHGLLLSPYVLRNRSVESAGC